MVLGLLQFELFVPGSESLKDKRRVVRSVKDRLHREHLVSIAEVGSLDSLDTAVLALAIVGTDGRYIGDVLDHISSKLRVLPDAQLAATRRDIFSSGALDAMTDHSPTPIDAESLRAELLAYATQRAEEGPR